jgi:hypothetical protein
MSVSWMPSKHLIAVVLLVCVCLGVVALYVWPGRHIAQPENAQPEVENVDLSYLAEHIAEFENKKVRVTGTVEYAPRFIMTREFRLKAGDAVVCVLLGKNVGYPLKNSVVTVEGTVHWYGLEGGFWAIAADNWFYEALTLRELLDDFDESTLGFKSYDPGDVIKIRDNVENTLLVSEAGWWKNTLYENIIENTYNTSYPITLIVMASCAEDIWQNPVLQYGVGKVIGLEGDVRDNYKIGEEAIVFIRIEKSDNTETARELGLGSLLWDLIYWID